jgi:dihydropteroate synthase
MTNDKGQLTIRDRSFCWGERTYLMGVLNVTPDSFSDGGEFNTPEAALAQAQRLVEAGVDILDIGGQSTRPGAEEVSDTVELERVLPVIKAVRSSLSVPISVDTTRASVAKAGVAVGADIVNDISGGTFDPDMFPVVAQLGVPIILMHIRGTPQTMQKLTDYHDLIGEIYEFLEGQIQVAINAGIVRFAPDH